MQLQRAYECDGLCASHIVSISNVCSFLGAGRIYTVKASQRRCKTLRCSFEASAGRISQLSQFACSVECACSYRVLLDRRVLCQTTAVQCLKFFGVADVLAELAQASGAHPCGWRRVSSSGCSWR